MSQQYRQHLVTTIERLLDYVASQQFRQRHPQLAAHILNQTQGYSPDDPIVQLEQIYYFIVQTIPPRQQQRIPRQRYN
jgi:hypothetical protein